MLRSRFASLWGVLMLAGCAANLGAPVDEGGAGVSGSAGELGDAGTGGATDATGGSTTGGTTSGGSASTDAGAGGESGGASAAGGTAGTGGTGSTESGAIGLGSDGILQIWTVGDSITEGVNNGYRNRVWTELRARGYTIDYVGSIKHPYPETQTCSDADHDGHGGFSIGDIARDLDGWYAAIAAPDVVLVMAGTNDIAWWTAQTDMGKVADKMMALVDDVLAKHGEVGVIVGTIAPMSSKVAASVNRDRAELTNEFNQALKAKVSGHAASGTRLWLADVNAKLTLADLYDGIHPTRAGHDKVANAWLEVLEPLLP